ncbi:proline racemase family protein [Virgibacillus byunsanensis]|uniref:Proline racemase family protein n=1 Tax=Virgibacillus byunsanensis TaxID=570945 RepID=A0ABW3LJW3_9BACI
MNIQKMFTTIDTHVAGEAFRIVTQSSITLDENDILGNHELLQRNFQNEKQFLLNEPRGHRGMNGCMVIPSSVADYALLFFNHESEIQFKYGGLITTITALLETGNIPVNENNRYEIETVEGIFTIQAAFENNEVTAVSLKSNECRLLEEHVEYSLVDVDNRRRYYVYSLPASLPGLHLDHLSSVMKWGKNITEKMRNENTAFAGVIITDSVDNSVDTIRSVTFERDGSIVRSPGIDSTFAIHTTLLNKKPVDQLRNYSIFDSTLTSKSINDSNTCFTMESQAFVTGMHQFIYDQADPLENGFLLK